MSSWAIGDIQGCFESFEALLGAIAFDPAEDRLWLAGDLVNRGPRSADVLRWVVDHEDHLISVLGNHDLHLLSRGGGLEAKGGKDTLDDLLEAPDRDAMLAWLRQRPLLHREGEHLLVHAGLHPSWSCARAADLAAEAEEALRGPRGLEVLERYRGPCPSGLPPTDDPLGRAAHLLQVFCRMRVCRADGTVDLDFKGPPSKARDGARAWFLHEHARGPEVTVLFGHWAALGFHRGPGVVGLDSGCVWGGSLTALCLNDGRIVQQPAIDGISQGAGG